jgi:hypothetical protein
MPVLDLDGNEEGAKITVVHLKNANMISTNHCLMGKPVWF